MLGSQPVAVEVVVLVPRAGAVFVAVQGVEADGRVDALNGTAALGGTLGDAWRRILEADARYGIADLGACYEFMNIIRSGDVSVRVEDPNYGGNFVLACAHGEMDSVILCSA